MEKKKRICLFTDRICAHIFSSCAARPCGNSLTQMFGPLFVFSTPLPGLPVMGIRMAIGRIRIGKVSLACRKTRPYSTAARRHTKDGTIKDLVLSSALCSPAFQHSASVHNSKKLVRVGGVNKAALAHFSMCEKKNFLQNLAFYQNPSFLQRRQLLRLSP